MMNLVEDTLKTSVQLIISSAQFTIGQVFLKMQKSMSRSVIAARE